MEYVATGHSFLILTCQIVGMAGRINAALRMHNHLDGVPPRAIAKNPIQEPVALRIELLDKQRSSHSFTIHVPKGAGIKEIKQEIEKQGHKVELNKEGNFIENIKLSNGTVIEGIQFLVDGGLLFKKNNKQINWLDISQISVTESAVLRFQDDSHLTAEMPDEDVRSQFLPDESNFKLHMRFVKERLRRMAEVGIPIFRKKISGGCAVSTAEGKLLQQGIPESNKDDVYAFKIDNGKVEVTSFGYKPILENLVLFALPQPVSYSTPKTQFVTYPHPIPLSRTFDFNVTLFDAMSRQQKQYDHYSAPEVSSEQPPEQPPQPPLPRIHTNDQPTHQHNNAKIAAQSSLKQEESMIMKLLMDPTLMRLFGRMYGFPVPEEKIDEIKLQKIACPFTYTPNTSPNTFSAVKSPKGSKTTHKSKIKTSKVKSQRTKTPKPKPQHTSKPRTKAAKVSSQKLQKSKKQKSRKVTLKKQKKKKQKKVSPAAKRAKKLMKNRKVVHKAKKPKKKSPKLSTKTKKVLKTTTKPPRKKHQSKKPKPDPKLRRQLLRMQAALKRLDLLKPAMRPKKAKTTIPKAQKAKTVTKLTQKQEKHLKKTVKKQKKVFEQVKPKAKKVTKEQNNSSNFFGSPYSSSAGGALAGYTGQGGLTSLLWDDDPKDKKKKKKK